MRGSAGLFGKRVEMRWMRSATTLRAMLRGPRADRSQILAFQSRRLREFVSHAYRFVPHYRRLFDRHGLKPEAVQSLDDLRAIPITSRDDLQNADPRELVASGVDPATLVEWRTSGSSGAPLTIRRSWMEERILNSFRVRAEICQGLRLTDRRATISTDRPIHPRDSQLHLRALQSLRWLRRRRFSSVDPSDELLAALEVFDPDVLSGLSSSIWRLARIAIERRSSDLSPRRVFCGGEVLIRSMRQDIESAFGTSVRETYGSHEFSLLGWECPAGSRLHVADNVAIVEVLANGRPAETGERGEVVATALYSFSMPFIRYRLGDIVTRGKNGCACGRTYATIESIQGRINDCFPLVDGGIAYEYDIIPVFTRDPAMAVRAFQVTQENLNKFLVLVVPTRRESGPAPLTGLVRDLRKKLGATAQIRLEIADEIPRGAGGKFRVLRSLVGPSPYADLDWASDTQKDGEES